MKLKIQRSQADRKGLFGKHKGVRFTLQYRVELNEEEKGLMDRYKYWDEVLISNERGDQFTMRNLTKGMTDQANGIDNLLHNEEVDISVCKTLKSHLSVLRSFGGNEVLEF